MHTQCNAEQLEFSCVERRRVVAAFDGGRVSSDAGALLLKRTDEAIRLIDRLAECFVDHRDAGAIEHSVRTLVAQRVFGIALGYEDLNDHETLRHDAVFGVLIGKLTARRARCAALAGKSTLNRLELHPSSRISRYHKILPGGKRSSGCG
jgi:Transposase DDE domain group 1